jgi:hypothetical protein
MPCKCNPAELIESIIDEINGGSELGRRLIDAINGAIPIVPAPESVPVAPPTEPEYADEVRWGAILATVNLVADTAENLLQLLALRSSGVSALSELIEAIPIIGPALSLGVDAIAWAAPLARDAFEAQDSASAREALACDVFCALRGAQWDFGQFNAAFQSALSQSVAADVGAIVAALDDILMGTLPPEIVWALALSAISATMLTGGAVLGVDVRRVAIVANAGVADDDYSQCDCESACTNFIEIDGNTPTPPSGWTLRDMTAAEYAEFSSHPLPPQLAWADYGDGIQRLGTDIISPNYGGASRAIGVRALQPPAGLTICRIELTYRTWGNGSQGQLAVWILDGAGQRRWYETRSSAGIDEQTATYYPDVEASVLCLRLFKLYSGGRVGFSRIKVFYT